MLKKFSDFHFTSELNEKATLDDLNYEYMKEYLVQTNAAADIRILSKLDMARAMNLIGDSEYGGLRAKNFAVLMFADRPEKYIPYARVEIIREVVGTDKMESKRFDGPIWIQAQQVIRYFEDNIHATYTIRDPQTNAAHKVDNWPSIMFVEMATNCILHKEYSKKQYVGIYIYKDHICFINHNRPLPPVTIEDMNKEVEFQDRNYLNVELKEMFFNLDLIQSYGSGIRRAKKAMEDNGSPKLVFEPDNDTDDYTMVTAYINEEYASVKAEEEKKDSFKNKDENVTENVIENVTEKFSLRTLKFLDQYSEKKREVAVMLLVLMSKDSHTTIDKMAAYVNKSNRTVLRYLKDFQDAEILMRQGSDKGGQWILL